MSFEEHNKLSSSILFECENIGDTIEAIMTNTSSLYLETVLLLFYFLSVSCLTLPTYLNREVQMQFRRGTI